MIKTSWSNLEVKQRTMVAGVAAFVIAAILLEFAVFPLWDARAKMKKTILIQSKKLEEIVKIDADVVAQDVKISRIRNSIASRRSDFTLFAYLEKKAVLANVKGGIKQMNSLQGIQSPSFEETLVDLKLEKITIKQLADFLFQIESPSEMIRIKRITVDKMKESPEYISVQLLIASYAPASPRLGGE